VKRNAWDSSLWESVSVIICQNASNRYRRNVLGWFEQNRSRRGLQSARKSSAGLSTPSCRFCGLKEEEDRALILRPTESNRD
jgi:hypothetical protein